MNRIILARDASAAWLEVLPELRISFATDAEVDQFVERAALAGMQIKAEGTECVAVLPRGWRC